MNFQIFTLLYYFKAITINYQQMTVTILTLVIGEDYRTGLAEALQSKVDYAKKHGYTYIQGGEESWDRERPIPWSKIPFVLSVMKTLPEGALLWLSDADVLITNPSIRLEECMIPLLPANKDLLMTLDACGHINSGNILFRNTAWMRAFWEKVWQRTDYLYHVWWENAAMIKVLDENIADFEKTEITGHHKKFNAFLRGVEGQPLWEQGDFLVHFAGVYDPKEISSLILQIRNGQTPRLQM